MAEADDFYDIVLSDATITTTQSDVDLSNSSPTLTNEQLIAFNYVVASSPTTSSSTSLPESDSLKTDNKEAETKTDNSSKEKNSTLSTANVTEFYFKFWYAGEEGWIEMYYFFAVAPAMQSYLGSNTVPDTQAGIASRGGVTLKAFNIPTGSPVYQVTGRQPDVMQLSGIFMGVEATQNGDAAITYYSGGPGNSQYGSSKSKASFDAQESARFFLEKVVKAGIATELTLRSTKGSVTQDANYYLRVRCYVQNLKLFTRRIDRIYYTMDIVILEILDPQTKLIPYK